MRHWLTPLVLLFTLTLATTQVYATQYVDTAYGRIAIPETTEISEALSAVNTATDLTDTQKNSRVSELNHASSILTQYTGLQDQESSFAQRVSKADQELSILENTLKELNAQLNAPLSPIPDNEQQDAEALTRRLADLNATLTKAQSDLSQASSELVNLQTLPNRAQSVIASNNTRIAELNEKLSTLSGKENTLEYRIFAFEVYTLDKENDFIEEQLSSQTILQDVANRKAAIAAVQIKNLNREIAQVQTYQNQLLKGSVPAEDYVSELFADIASMQDELSGNEQIVTQLNRQLQSNSQMTRELNLVESALAASRQMERNLNEQLNSLNSSLLLSRLLNRQQSEIPEVKISYNLNELIPNLNLWLYDLRVYRDKIVDADAYIEELIARHPDLESRKADLRTFVQLRKSLVDQLYQAMSLGLASAINLKVRYEELQTVTTRVKATVNDHLFWLASNQPLGADLLFSLPRLLKAQVSSFIKSAQNPAWIKDTLTTMALVLIPLSLIYFGVRRADPKLLSADNRMALNLGKSSDSLRLTFRALAINLVRILPRVALITGIGTVFASLVLDDRREQMSVILMVLLHVLVFTYTLALLKPNGFAQRYFCVPPRILERRYTFIDRVYIAVLPIIIVANIRELDPTQIGADNIGYLIMLVCSAALVCILLRSIRGKLTAGGLKLIDLFKISLSLALPLALFIMLALGYYYTAIKLVNRVAFTFYTVLLYALVSQTVRRSLFVMEEQLMRKSRENRILPCNLTKETGDTTPKASTHQSHSETAASSSQSSVPSSARASFGTALGALSQAEQNALALTQNRSRSDTLRMELINFRAFRLINTVLLCLTAIAIYLQWNDLAGVLTYLDTVHLWSSSETIDGQLVITSYLSLADICLAILILLITMVLNRNLPALLERLSMLGLSGGHKSTGYTIRIVTSYAIITIGIILTAGALGISWNNLQWLVAALSVGLGFGLQEIFGNFVSGLIILFERQIRVGDIITLNNLSGTVSKIRIRSTTIVAFDNKEVMIPNKSFITSALTNWSLSNTVTKLEFVIGVAYGTDLEKAKNILRNIILSCGNLAPDKAFSVYVTAMMDSCINITADVFVSEIGKRKPTFDYLCQETLRRFDAAGIEIPFNQLEVRLKNTITGESLKVSP